MLIFIKNENVNINLIFKVFLTLTTYLIGKFHTQNIKKINNII